MQVQEGMIESLRDVMIRAVTAYAEVPRPRWVLEWSGQVVIAVSSIYWTTDVNNAIVNGTLKVCICVCGVRVWQWWGKFLTFYFKTG